MSGDSAAMSFANIPTPARRGRGRITRQGPSKQGAAKKEYDVGFVPNHDQPHKASSSSTASISSVATPVPGDGVAAAVASVKKSSRGCAVVWLTDAEVLARSVLQRVAVVDGVCVEIRRHSKEGSAPPSEESSPSASRIVGAVFVAWGHRVERRACVSEEGLQAYFNSLAGLARPSGLTPAAPFVEELLSFDLVSSCLHFRPLGVRRPLLEKATASMLLASPFCERHLVEALWSAKDRLDSHWERPPPPLGRSLLIRVARAQLFPHSGDGGKEHENRAGDKLQELADAVGLLEGLPRYSAFLDLCGGPGAWSQMLLARGDLALRGYGLTLRSDSGAADDWHAQEKDQWYPDLLARDDWTALWGADGSGDLLKPGNLEHSALQLADQGVCLCVADGGFSDDGIPSHQQELYVYRLLLAELLMAASCLQPGGRFVCKLYSTFSLATAALLAAAVRLFASVRVVKPMSSRATGPERYLVAFGFRRSVDFNLVYHSLCMSHQAGGAASPLAVPLLTPLLSAEDILEDKAFHDSMRQMTTALCQRQTKALTAVVDQADHLEELACGDGDHGDAHLRYDKDKSCGKSSRLRRHISRGGA